MEEKEKELTYAQEAIKRLISEKTEMEESAFQDYNESYSDYTYFDASVW